MAGGAAGTPIGGTVCAVSLGRAADNRDTKLESIGLVCPEGRTTRSDLSIRATPRFATRHDRPPLCNAYGRAETVRRARAAAGRRAAGTLTGSEGGEERSIDL